VESAAAGGGGRRTDDISAIKTRGLDQNHGFAFRMRTIAICSYEFSVVFL
jgi:hypothetical protein